MDFTTTLLLAQKNQQTSKQGKYGGLNTDLPAPKREKQEKKRSEVVQRLIDEKRREEREERKRKEEETKKKHPKEEKKKDFRIPKKAQKPDIDNLLKDLESDVESSDDQQRVERNSKSYDKGKEKNGQKHDNLLKNEKHKSDHSEHKSEKHKSHSGSDKHSSDKHRNDKHSSEKHSSDKHSSDKHSSDNHQSDKHSNDKHRSDKHRSDKHSSDKHHSSSSKHSDSKHRSDKPSNDKHHTDKHKHDNRDSKSDKHKSSTSSSSSSKHHSSSSRDKDKRSEKSSGGSSKKSSALSLGLDELRAEVKQMKQDAKEIDAKEEKEKKLAEFASSAADVISFQKCRQGIGGSVDEGEEKKAKILSRTQMILERTKARLAAEKEGAKQKRQGGKRSGDRERSDKGNDKIKSRSVVKDDYDSADDNDINPSLDLSFNQELLKTESGDIMKDIKKKIDEKLGNYNFPDRPVKEKERRIRSRDVHSSVKKHSKEKMRDKIRDRHRDKLRDKQQLKRDKIKEMMRKDYKSNFTGDNCDEQRPKVKKPVIIRRQQGQPPPINFNDLLKLAATKSKQKVPEPVFKPPKKTVEERPMTQDELDRRRRAEDHRRRREEEDKGIRNKPTEEKIKAKSDSNILRGALTGTTGKDSPVRNSSQSQLGGAKGTMGQKGPKGPSAKYDAENENVLVCKPSSSGGGRGEPQVAATNPFDRIIGQFKKNNPKPEKRRQQQQEMLDYSDEEEDEYDEDDDFIDNDAGVEDYSAHIRNIFGYDKRKYRHIDEDDSDMEANFATIMKEEARSAKIGKMEDLEDIRREEEELRQEKLRKKMRRK